LLDDAFCFQEGRRVGLRFDNSTLCSFPIQRVYRNAVVRHLRARLKEEFRDDWLGRLKAPFSREWATIDANARLTRDTGQLAAPLVDEFDILSVNHFYNLFDSYWAILGGRHGESEETAKSRKKTVLTWMQQVKTLRDPLAHPAEGDVNYDDASVLTDAARRALESLRLKDEALVIKEVQGRLRTDVAHAASSGRRQRADVAKARPAADSGPLTTSERRLRRRMLDTTDGARRSRQTTRKRMSVWKALEERGHLSESELLELLEGKIKARGQFVSSYSAQSRSPLLSRVPGASFGESEECFIVNPKLARAFSAMLAGMEKEEPGSAA
jgi:hypothetical protein